MNIEDKLVFLSQFIKPKDLVFDIGASMGEMTHLYLELGAKVIAVDPQPTAAATLRTRYAGNSNVTVVPIALGDSVGKATMHICRSYGGVFSTMTGHWIDHVNKAIPNAEWEPDIEVPVTTLDNLIDSYGIPSFIKIDTEAFEKYVIKGLTHRIPAFSFEYSSDCIERDTIPVVEYCKRMWKCEFNYIGAEEFRFVLPNWTNGDEIVSALLNSAKMGDSWGDMFVRTE